MRVVFFSYNINRSALSLQSVAISTDCKLKALRIILLPVARQHNGMKQHHHHHHYAAVVSHGWAKASACRIQVSLSCAVLCHIVSLQYLSRSSLHRLAGIHCRILLPYGLQVVTREVHRSSLRRLICHVQDDLIFSHSADYIYDLCPLPDPDVGLSIFVCDVEHTSFHFGLCGRKFVLCLFGQCPGLSTICHNWQRTGVVHFSLQADGKVAFEDIPVFGYAVQPAMILRCVSLPWLFSLML